MAAAARELLTPSDSPRPGPLATLGLRRLVVVSHVRHYRWGGQLFAYGPYAREIDVWADLFPEVWIAAPCHDAAPPSDCLAFTRGNIDVLPQPESGGDSITAKLRQVLAMPWLLWRLGSALARADAVHVRCPGSLGFLGVLMAPRFTRNVVAKYAGQWNGFSGEPWTWKVQRALLASPLWPGPVTVYGDWPGQPANVVPFFTSILSERQVGRARASAASRGPIGDPLRVLFVGRLSKQKNVDVLLEALAGLGRESRRFRLRVVGDGPERPQLEERARRLGIAEAVEFAGAVDFEKVLDFYEDSDVLVLASQTEGWPKAIAEGMAFGLICIGTDRGMVPQMLGEERGILVTPEDRTALVAALRGIALEPGRAQAMSRRAAEWAGKHSLEGLREAIGSLLAKWWRPGSDADGPRA
jgi:glycosyltransferase involved in cell wall biosynthesis